jgi:hypothetical protein
MREQPLDRPAPDAFDKLCDTVYIIAVVRNDAAHAAMHMHQPPVTAREEQQPTQALTVVSQWHLRKKHVSNTK